MGNSIKIRRVMIIKNIKTDSLQKQVQESGCQFLWCDHRMWVHRLQYMTVSCESFHDLKVTGLFICVITAPPSDCIANYYCKYKIIIAGK